MLDRLVIGTANWGRDYNGHCVDEKEQNLIMEYMKEIGIEWLDVATAYGTENVGKDKFSRIVKVSEKDNLLTLEQLCYRSPKEIVISHSYKGYDNLKTYFAIRGYSCDIGDELIEGCYVEWPHSVLYRLIPPCFSRIIARSIFCKGKALKYFSPRECLDFVLMNPRIDKVILGVDSVDQLRENVAHLVKMEKFTHNEEVDTRKF